MKYYWVRYKGELRIATLENGLFTIYERSGIIKTEAATIDCEI